MSGLKQRLVRLFFPWRDREYQLEKEDARMARLFLRMRGHNFVGRLECLHLSAGSKKYYITIPTELVDHLHLKAMKTYDLNICEETDE